jgi:transcription antitermination factor NusG
MAVELRLEIRIRFYWAWEGTGNWDSKGGSIRQMLLEHTMNVENPYDISQRWFALRVKSRREKVVAMMAQNKGFEEFLPLYQSRRRWSDRLQSVELPLFPGYLFCRLNPQHRLPLLTIPGVLHFVGIGKIPAPIEDVEIAALQTAARSGLLTEPWPFLEIGQRVRLDEGPLAGLEGILVGTSKPERIVVSVTLLKRSVAVSIERHWATPLSDSGRTLPIQMKPFLAESSPCR